VRFFLHSIPSLFNFVRSMGAQQSPAESVAEIQVALRDADKLAL
jgi:hypothetical protein